MKTASVYPCCDKLVKEVFKSQFIYVDRPGHINGEMKDDAVVSVRIGDPKGANHEIHYCPFCGDILDIQQIILERKHKF